MGRKNNKSARDRVDALPDLTDLARTRILEIARKIQRWYSDHRRTHNPETRYVPSGESDPSQWVTLAARLFQHSIDPNIYMAWVAPQMHPKPMFPTTVSSEVMFERFLVEGTQLLHQRLDKEIRYSANCLLSRVGVQRTMLDVLTEEVAKVGFRATDQTLSGSVAASPDHLDVVVLYIACKEEPGAASLVQRLFPYAKSAIGVSPYVQSRIASQLPQELLDGPVFTAADANATTQAVHGVVPVPKPSRP